MLVKDTDALQAQAGVDDGCTEGVDGVGVYTEVEVEGEDSSGIEMVIVTVGDGVEFQVKVESGLDTADGFAVAMGSVPSGQVSGGIA